MSLSALIQPLPLLSLSSPSPLLQPADVSTVHDALDRITQTLFARMQQKGTMMISFNPLKDHGLPRFFRLIVNNVTVCGVHSCQIAGIKRERQRCAESETGRQADTDRQINTNTDTHRHTQTH